MRYCGKGLRQMVGLVSYNFARGLLSSGFYELASNHPGTARKMSVCGVCTIEESVFKAIVSQEL